MIDVDGVTRYTRCGQRGRGLVGAGGGLQTLAIQSRTLTLNGPAEVRSNGTFALSSGALAGSGQLNIAGHFDWSGGGMAGSGTTHVAVGSVTTLSSGNTKVLRDGRRWENAGAATWTDGSILVDSGSATFVNLAGGVFDIQAGGRQFTDSCGQGLVIENLWTLRKSGSTDAVTRGVTFGRGDKVVHNRAGRR